MGHAGVMSNRQLDRQVRGGREGQEDSLGVPSRGGTSQAAVGGKGSGEDEIQVGMSPGPLELSSQD